MGGKREEGVHAIKKSQKLTRRWQIMPEIGKIIQKYAKFWSILKEGTLLLLVVFSQLSVFNTGLIDHK